MNNLIVKYRIYYDKAKDNKDIQKAYENILKDLLELRFKIYRDYNLDIDFINYDSLIKNKRSKKND